MRKILSATALWLSITLPAGARDGVGTEDVIVALTDSTPNFSMHMPDGSFRGINVEIATQLCDRLHLSCRFRPMPLVALIAQVRDGKAQIGFGNLAKTPEREKFLLYSQPYWRSTSVLVGRRDLAGKPMAELVRGRKVAVQEGSRQEKWLQDSFGTTVTTVPRPTIFDVAAALALQQADLALAPMIPLHPFLTSPEGAEFTFVSDPIDGGSSVHVVVTKDRPDLMAQVDATLEEMRRDGSLGRIVRTWVPFDIF